MHDNVPSRQIAAQVARLEVDVDALDHGLVLVGQTADQAMATAAETRARAERFEEATDRARGPRRLTAYTAAHLRRDDHIRRGRLVGIRVHQRPKLDLNLVQVCQAAEYLSGHSRAVGDDRQEQVVDANVRRAALSCDAGRRRENLPEPGRGHRLRAGSHAFILRSRCRVRNEGPGGSEATARTPRRR